MRRYIFACIHSAGRSQMAAAFFNALADPTQAHAISAGTNPASRIHPEVLIAMHEAGIDLSQAEPQKLTAALAQGAELLITMGCGDKCPYVPGFRHDDWPLPDPKGQPMETVRLIRDQIRHRIHTLLQNEGIPST